MNKLTIAFFICLTSVAQARTIEAFRCEAQATEKPGTVWKTVFEYPQVNPFTKEKFLSGYTTGEGWQSWGGSFDFSQYVETESHILFGGAADGKPGGVRIELDKLTSIARFCVYRGPDFLQGSCTEGMSASGLGVYYDVKDTGKCAIHWKAD